MDQKRVLLLLEPTQPPVQGYWVSFPGLKRPGRGVDHLPRSSTEVKERIECYFYYLSVRTITCYGANFAFYV